MSIITPYKKLESLKAERLRIINALDFARKDLARKQLNVGAEAAEKVAKGEAWIKILERNQADNAVQIKTIELGVARTVELAKSCVTASGKRLRP